MEKAILWLMVMESLKSNYEKAKKPAMEIKLEGALDVDAIRYLVQATKLNDALQKEVEEKLAKLKSDHRRFVKKLNKALWG